MCNFFLIVLHSISGEYRIRTDDPLLAGQVLYQLSYTPVPAHSFLLLLFPAPRVISAASSKNNASLALGLLPAKESTRLLKTKEENKSQPVSARLRILSTCVSPVDDSP